MNSYNINSIVKALVRRDGYTREEATELADSVMGEVMSLIGEGEFSAAEEIFTSELCIEPDFLMNAII